MSSEALIKPIDARTPRRRDLAVSVRGLGKAYTIAHETGRATTVAEALFHRLRHPFEKPERETFWALQDVSFDIYAGDVVGVTGRNGAGKSTLLKLLSRITEPTAGQIDLYGRVGSLLEVGTGFHPELTGRENIYFNGSILGMTRAEIDRQFDAIVDFAEIERFLDTPVKRYSSGMYVKLAFAVAAHLSTEILIVDEVLAVGDAQFQKKCLGKMQNVAREGGRTVLFVSHNMAAIRSLCTRALLLQQGRVLVDGDVETAVAAYIQEGSGSLSEVRWHRERRTGDDMHFTRAAYLDSSGEVVVTQDCHEPFSLMVEYELYETLTGLRLGFDMQTAEGVPVCHYNDPDWSSKTRTPGRYRFTWRFPANLLNHGTFVARFYADIPNDRMVRRTDYELSLSVEDLTGHGSSSERLPGLLRPQLMWDETPLESPGTEKAGATEWRDGRFAREHGASPVP
jgi:lipopolysaccharide transport system ATP-binding protein